MESDQVSISDCESSDRPITTHPSFSNKHTGLSLAELLRNERLHTESMRRRQKRSLESEEQRQKRLDYQKSYNKNHPKRKAISQPILLQTHCSSPYNSTETSSGIRPKPYELSSEKRRTRRRQLRKLETSEQRDVRLAKQREYDQSKKNTISKAMTTCENKIGGLCQFQQVHRDSPTVIANNTRKRAIVGSDCGLSEHKRLCIRDTAVSFDENRVHASLELSNTEKQSSPELSQNPSLKSIPSGETSQNFSLNYSSPSCQSSQRFSLHYSPPSCESSKNFSLKYSSSSCQGNSHQSSADCVLDQITKHLSASRVHHDSKLTPPLRVPAERKQLTNCDTSNFCLERQAQNLNESLDRQGSFSIASSQNFTLNCSSSSCKSTSHPKLCSTDEPVEFSRTDSPQTQNCNDPPKSDTESHSSPSQNLSLNYSPSSSGSNVDVWQIGDRTFFSLPNCDRIINGFSRGTSKSDLPSSLPNLTKNSSIQNTLDLSQHAHMAQEEPFPNVIGDITRSDPVEDAHLAEMANEEHFNDMYNKAINSFCEFPCAICTKLCYRSQIANIIVPQKAYLPDSLRAQTKIMVCTRCNTHLKSDKDSPPSKAFWNHLDPGPQPDVLKSLTQSEIRLLSRMIPFVKVVKLDGKFGQFGFKGQAILFAQDIHEVAERLPSMLPRSPSTANIIIVTEHLDNLDIVREFSISRERVYAALVWLIANNPLYRDVTIDSDVDLSSDHIVRVIEPPSDLANIAPQAENDFYKHINEQSKILRSSWSFIDKNTFTHEYVGCQSLAIALVNIVKATIVEPTRWSACDLDHNLLSGDQLYHQIRSLNSDQEQLIPDDNHLRVEHLNVLKPEFELFGSTFGLVFSDDPDYIVNVRGNIRQNRNNNGNPCVTLQDAFSSLFANHRAAVICSNIHSVSVMTFDDFYFLVDPQPCGPKGSKARTDQGKACVIACTNITELERICKRALGCKNKYYNLHIVEVTKKPPDEQICGSTTNRDPQTTSQNNQQRTLPTLFIEINSSSRIIRATTHQGNSAIFHSGYAGVQCCAMVLSNFARALILPPNEWSTDTLDENMQFGDSLYSIIHGLSRLSSIPISADGFLQIRNFHVIKDFFSMYNRDFSIKYDDDTSLYGNLQDNLNSDGFGLTLLQSLNTLFLTHYCGMIITRSYAYGLMKKDGKFYISDSHSCDSRGLSADENGRACLIECDSILDLHQMCLSKFGGGNFEYNLHHIEISVMSESATYDSHDRVRDPANAISIDLCPNRPSGHSQIVQLQNVIETIPDSSPNHLSNPNEPSAHNGEPESTPRNRNGPGPNNPAGSSNPSASMHIVERGSTEEIHHPSQYVPIQTSLMLPNDARQPDIEEIFDVDGDMNKIIRKTKDNIVNTDHEGRAEEFAFYHLFPYGVNGLKEPTRPVKISPLDYFQYRILGTDPRFTFKEYLFFALSTYEYERVKQTLSACGKKIQGQNGIVDDLHLYLQNIRGSASYWARALSDLIAMIRLLGEPHYFATFSCNDLHWYDMKKALLIADGRPDVDPNEIDIMETQRLIELYPVILSRHFMVHVHALLKRLNNDPSIFKAKVVDHWWRIEFQNRGSPHLHMVIWLENYPSFDTEEGRKILDEVITCELPPEDSPIHELVVKCQIHHHTATCKKNNTPCRFHFPREECPATRIVAHSSDEFIRSGGRICLLKRRKEDRWVNNYNVKLLKMWKGNMDIQPCGSNEAIAYYICKYLAKGEPTQLSSGIAEAIRQIRNEENDISRKLFKICMKILHERQVSAPECAFRLCHLPLRSSSRKCMFLNTRKPDDRYRVIKFNQNDEACGFYCNIFDRYENRPRNHRLYDFDNMSLLEFAMNFEPYYKKQIQDEEEPVDEFPEPISESSRPNRKEIITLTGGQKMIKRTRPAVVRTPYFRLSDNPEGYYYSLLLQYLPYRREEELLDGYDSAKDAFLARENRLQQVNQMMQMYRKRDQQLENAFNQIHAFDILNEVPILADENEEPVADEPMDEDRFQQGMKSLNLGQRGLLVHVTESVQRQINGSEERLKIFLTGNAGTGKTMALNLLEEQLFRCYQRRVVKKCALTGAAAKLTKGSTIHSLLKLPVQRDGKIVNMPMLTGNYLRQMRLIWRDVEFLFIDEISMVPYEMLCMIDSRLRQLKNNDNVFGGINIILFGDLMQLPPVNGSPVFRQPSHMIPATHLWRLFTLVELTENMRQRSSRTFVDILNALRVGEMKDEHFTELIKRANIDQVGEFSIEKAIRIYPTNDQVNSHNTKVLNYFRERGTIMYKIVAQDVLIDATRNLQNLTVADVTPTDINKTGGLPDELEIFVGAKVMLRANIDVSIGLVNGSMGVITEIIWPYFRRDQVDARDIPSIRIDFGNDGIHVIQPRSIQFPAKHNFGTIERRMLPMILSFASTVHKLQGSTVGHAVVYLGPRLFAAGQAYVGLSRVPGLDKLCVEHLDCSKLTGKKPCNVEALAEMERLRNLQINSP